MTSTQPEVGVIPQDWRSSIVRDIASSARNSIVGGPFGSDLVSKDYVAHGVPVIRGQNMSGQWVSGSFVFVTPLKAKSLEANLVHPEDIIFTQRGTLGQVSLVPAEPFSSYLVSQSQMKLSVDRNVADPLFLFYLFTSDEQQKLIQDRTIQTGVPHINLGILREIPVRLPPLAEQCAIAEVLSDVDQLLGALEKLIAKKQAIKQATMQQLLTGKTRLPGFSGEWETKQLGEVIHLVPSGIYGLGRQIGLLIGMPVATTAHIDPDDRWNNKKMDIRYFTKDQITHFSPMEGDLIVVKSSGSAASIQSGKIGYVSRDRVGSFIFSNFMMLLRPTHCNAQFLFFQLVSSRVKKMLPYLVEASTYPNLRINDYLELQISLPPDKEQAEIVDVLSDMDAEIAALEQRRDKTHVIKQGMMQQLLTGRVRLVSTREGNDHVL